MRLHDTLTGELVELPAPPANIGMYVCGPTVYQLAHIGNARPYVVFSWMARWMRETGHDVKLVHNITDVNDKIYEAAPGASAQRAEEATQWYLDDVARFGLDAVNAYPKVTETMDEIIAFIAELIVRDHAYARDGDVYFRVASYPGYGELSGQRPDQMEDSEPNPLKDDPRDFALWKANKPGEDTAWESPWGRGRPGWHIECSAMAARELGSEFWVHGGGLDIVFPHHENELAQSRSVGHPFAKIWAHNGMLRFTGEKMSKSLGNVETIRDVLDRWGVETTLLFFLTAHWRKPLDFSDETMAAARAQLDSFRNAVASSVEVPGDGSEWKEFAAALDDDFNTPSALAILHGWRERGYIKNLIEGLRVFGINPPRSVTIDAPSAVATAVSGTAHEIRVVGELPADVHEIAERRYAAREDKDFVAADLLREELERRGWRVRDQENGYLLELIT